MLVIDGQGYSWVRGRLEFLGAKISEGSDQEICVINALFPFVFIIPREFIVTLLNIYYRRLLSQNHQWSLLLLSLEEREKNHNNKTDVSRQLFHSSPLFMLHLRGHKRIALCSHK